MKIYFIDPIEHPGCGPDSTLFRLTDGHSGYCYGEYPSRDLAEAFARNQTESQLGYYISQTKSDENPDGQLHKLVLV